MTLRSGSKGVLATRKVRVPRRTGRVSPETWWETRRREREEDLAGVVGEVAWV